MAGQPLVTNPLGAPAQEAMTIQSVNAMSAPEVAKLIQNRGFGEVAPLFEQHKITGSRLLSLEAEDLKEMKITKVGDRLGIQQAIEELKTKARAVWRQAVIAEHEELYPHRQFHRLIHTCCGLCPPQMDQYKLTNTQLKITHSHSPVCCGMKCACLGVNVQHDAHPLDQIGDVDTANVRDGCCAVASSRVTCHLTQMSQGDGIGGREKGGYEQRPTAEMSVSMADGDTFAEQIRNAIEEYKRSASAGRR